MKEVFVKICEKYIRYWHQLKHTNTMNGLPMDAVNELLQVFQQHNKSFEGICKWCPDSQVYLVRQVFQAYERDAPKPIMDSVLKTHVERPNGMKLHVEKTKPTLFLKEGVRGKSLNKTNRTNGRKKD